MADKEDKEKSQKLIRSVILKQANVKLSFVNFSHLAQYNDITVKLPFYRLDTASPMTIPHVIECLSHNYQKQINYASIVF